MTLKECITNLVLTFSVKKLIAPPKAPLGAKVQCPLCDKEFGTSFAVRRHMTRTHKSTPKELEQCVIPTTSKKCKHCGVYFSNVYKHLGTCKMKDTVMESDSDKQGDVPAEFSAGGQLLLAEWDTWFPLQGLSKGTQKSYTAKLLLLISYFEQTINKFKADMLLYPLELELSFPSMSGYLTSCTTGGDKATSIKTYRYLCDLILQLFNNR